MYNWSNISLRVDTLMLEGPEFGRLAQHSAGLPDTLQRVSVVSQKCLLGSVFLLLDYLDVFLAS